VVHLPPGGALIPVSDTNDKSVDDQGVDKECDATERIVVAPVDGVHAFEARADANQEVSGTSQLPGTNDSTFVMDDAATDLKITLALDQSSTNVQPESSTSSESSLSQAQDRVEEASPPIAVDGEASRRFLDRQSASTADEQQQQMQKPIDDIFLFGRPQLLFGFVQIIMMILSLYISLWITNYAFWIVPQWMKVRRKRHSVVMRASQIIILINVPVFYLLAVCGLPSIPGGNVQLCNDGEVVSLVEGNLK
jgi:hypothetical protein